MQNISDPFIRAGCKNLKKLNVVYAIVIVILITSFAPTHFIKKDFIVGVNLVNAPYYLSVPDQDSILTAMQNAGVRVIRAGLPSNQRGFDFARRVYSHGMKIALLVDVQFTKGTPWPVTPKGFKGLWRSPPLSKADPDVFRAYFAPLLARLEETGIVISSFELGNEINWAGFSPTFPFPGRAGC